MLENSPVLIIVSFSFEAEKPVLEILGPALFGMVRRGNPLICPHSGDSGFHTQAGAGGVISIDYAVTDEISTFVMIPSFSLIGHPIP